MRTIYLVFWWSTAHLLLAQSAPSVSAEEALYAYGASTHSVQQADPVAGEVVNGYYYRRIYCEPLPSTRARAALEAEGVEFVSYQPRNIYLVALPAGFDEGRLALVNARRVWAVAPEDKIHRNLKERPYGAWAVVGECVQVYVQVYPQMRIEEAAGRFRAMGHAVVEEGQQNGFLHLCVRGEAIAEVAALPFVRYMELLPPHDVPDDINGRSLHRSGLLDMDSPLGRKYDGTGTVAVVRDDGPLGPHIDFQGRYTDWTADDGLNNGTHGDGVAGILGGAGNLDPRMRGMAAGTHLHAVRYRANFQDYPTLHLLDLYGGALVTNTSYSNGCNAGYTLIAQTVEEQLVQYPALMHVFSAGNDGDSNCNYGAGANWGNITGGHKMAKNALAVANLRADGTLTNTSSRGPAHDGRLKPDLAAHGQGQRSTAHDHTYQTFSGTSAAAPGVAGVWAQLTQAYREHFDGQQPPAMLLKAALLNTANDMGNRGPDFQFGWGLVNAWRAFRLLVEKRWILGQVEHGETTTHTITVPQGTRQCRIMLYWHDVPAEAGTVRALVNDLDVQVISPDGAVHLPQVLDHRPDPSALSKPAQPGRDSINNVEQVAIIAPEPGTHTVQISGYEVPLGPVSYVVAWQFDDDSLTLVYPAGGEALAPGDTCRIHWDAFGDDGSFLLHYSTDDGQSWLPIEALEGTKRLYDWRVPNIISASVRVRVSRGDYSSVAALPVSIVRVPENLTIERVCLDSATVSWTRLNDTLQYDVYLLGQKYMEIAGTTAENRFTLPITAPDEEKWFSVRASMPSGLAGRRALAVRWSGGLKECAYPYDLALREVISPTKSALESAVACEPTTWTVRVRLANEGTLSAEGATIHYQLNNESPITEALPSLAAGEVIEWVFSTPLVINQSGLQHLQIWLSFPLENVFFNDTIRLSFRTSVEPRTEHFTEGFEAVAFPPLNWAVFNPDNDITWRRYSTSIVGLDSQFTFATFMNFFSYAEIGAEDYLYLPPIDLDKLTPAELVFNWAYTTFSSEYEDSLRIEAFLNCDLNSDPIVLWGRRGSALATIPPLMNEFFPTSPSHWRKARVPLAPLAGQRIIIRFVGVNFYGNNLFIDNVGIVEPTNTTPQAIIFASADTICRTIDTVRFWAGNPVGEHLYAWSFGNGAQPSTATGPGPHAVRYVASGARQVRLVVSDWISSDTASYSLHIIGTPSANFTWVANGATVTFTNTSTNAETFLWDFGDGNSSNETNPVHTYALPGQYTVVLRAFNRCSSSPVMRQQVLDLDFVHTREPEEVTWARVVPNPAAGAFALEVALRAGVPVRAVLTDARGQLLEERNTFLGAGQSAMRFEASVWGAGVYWLHLHTPTGTLVRRVVVTP